MSDPRTREMDREPAALPLLLKSALPVIPGVSMLPGVRRSGSTLPELTLTRHDVPVDRAHVAAYSEVCGFGMKDTLPQTYPHLFAFPLHMAVMTDPEFPFPTIGTIHLENSITQHRPITTSERLQITVRPEGLRTHRRGTVFDLVTLVHSAGELVWEETSTFLRKGRSLGDTAHQGLELETVPSTGIVWRLPGDLGRRYAAVSGDHNPIHTYGITAKAFGFPRQIAHGMWSTARCVAMLEPRLSESVRVDVAFKKPVVLPVTVAFGSRRLSEGSGAGHRGDWAFSLTSPKDGAPHLLGRATAP